MKSLYKVCKKHGSVLTYTMEPPSDESDSENDINNNQVLLPDDIQKYKSEHDIVERQEFLEYLCNIHTPEIIRNIESITKEQIDDPMWHEYRKGRITASIMGSVLKCNMERLNENNYIVKKIQSSATFFSTQATDYGKSMEGVARNQYTEQYIKSHQKAEILKAGLSISPACPIIAASPDGYVKCLCGGEGLLEIKCTYTHQHKYTKDIASENNYVHLVNDEVKLKENSPWYSQIQTQLFVTGKSWCDFVLFTQKDFATDRIYFNAEYFDMCLKKAIDFYFKFIM
ncbi:uncharacterized protein LOC133198720 isoform X1 [Saccostrea echinata]|uniref:uncharacterized protein LOC133198720 isoform X1 n=1 Tax=Saccostrea echinata TaxID=191078 RepID=UPI002A7FAE32|nr:uncharacterized protein LOC133198720 isoform X1 [Saccostrea echinata]